MKKNTTTLIINIVIFLAPFIIKAQTCGGQISVSAISGSNFNISVPSMSGGYYLYQWNFGDGFSYNSITYGDAYTAYHGYQSSGNFTVQLSVYNCGNSITGTTTPVFACSQSTVVSVNIGTNTITQANFNSSGFACDADL